MIASSASSTNQFSPTDRSRKDTPRHQTNTFRTASPTPGHHVNRHQGPGQQQLAGGQTRSGSAGASPNTSASPVNSKTFCTLGCGSRISTTCPAVVAAVRITTSAPSPMESMNPTLAKSMTTRLSPNRRPIGAGSTRVCVAGADRQPRCSTPFRPSADSDHSVFELLDLVAVGPVGPSGARRRIELDSAFADQGAEVRRHPAEG